MQSPASLAESQIDRLRRSWQKFYRCFLGVGIAFGKKIQPPRFESDDYIMVAGSSRPLMEAHRMLTSR